MPSACTSLFSSTPISCLCASSLLSCSSAPLDGSGAARTVNEQLQPYAFVVSEGDSRLRAYPQNYASMRLNCDTLGANAWEGADCGNKMTANTLRYKHFCRPPKPQEIQKEIRTRTFMRRWMDDSTNIVKTLG